MTRRGRGLIEGIEEARRSQVQGTGRGRYPATPYNPRQPGGATQAASPTVGPSTLVDTLTLTANSQQVASGGDDVTWHNELVGLTPRDGFAGYGATPTATVTMPAAGRLFTGLTLERQAAVVGEGTAWTVRWHVTRGTRTLTFDMPAASTFATVFDAPPLTVKAGDVLKVQVIQSSGAAETLDGATLHLTLIHTTVRSEPPEAPCVIAGTATLRFAAPGPNPADLAWDGTHLWNADQTNATLYKLNPADGTVVQQFASPASLPTGLTWDGTHLWNADEGTDRIYKLNPADGTVVQQFASPSTRPTGLTWDGTHLWNADTDTGRIYRIDPASGAVDRSIVASADLPLGLTWDGTHLWNSAPNIDTIHRLDPADGTVVQAIGSPGGTPWGLAMEIADGCRLWHCNRDPDDIYTIE